MHTHANQYIQTGWQASGTHTYVHINTNIHTDIYAYMQTSIHPYTLTCIQTDIQTYRQPYIQIERHALHTYSQAERQTRQINQTYCNHRQHSHIHAGKHAKIHTAILSVKEAGHTYTHAKRHICLHTHSQTESRHSKRQPNTVTLT